ncbi:molybdopterin-guanine dinucleotide biosynthesis protein B [Acidianus infernus]|uniref:Molybdopterin-guanine dinucleotide biosynthesis protein B n=1 Tax=Acidianus infernus TaxID=12915 RepID=A0A6A9QEL1_ACIIN|nr:molybdopterin-guanine dinucleotide biosynthesis protein B [Acidianus infernus]MCY0873624.1 molybdopterin-guanine dinucleotide biosynthesis protein B [Acidianus infernus]MCY0883640.1 molybdopterin-guanine dinucleotide biosynthesis protein B [Acidianus infernus]MUM64725.1 molybdopterin-guanine dinucleotide biosynthesis protein B [Acidianus infernus]
MACVFQIVGKKDSGKTTTILEVIKELKRKRKDLIIAVVKHSHHVIDDENKDTFKFKKEGADLVIFHSNDCALFFDCKDFDYLSLFPADIILIEGFKDLNLGDKFEIRSPEEAKEIAENISKKAEGCISYPNIEINGEKAQKSLLTFFLYTIMKKYGIKEIRIAD